MNFVILTNLNNEKFLINFDNVTEIVPRLIEGCTIYFNLANGEAQMHTFVKENMQTMIENIIYRNA